MALNKLQKFAENSLLPNVYENPNAREPSLIGINGEEVQLKGKWHENHFKNQNPITLELACGRGEYTVALGRMYPNRNFIGVDIKGARIWQGAKTADTEGLKNVAFLRTQIELIALFFAENEIDEIWITFPDPFLNENQSNRRLTAPWFLNKYRLFLKKNGIIHLKTDSPVLSRFTIKTIENTEGATLISSDDNIHANPNLTDELCINTYYENKNIAKSSIKYIRFTI